MPISIQDHAALRIHLIDLSGKLTGAELRQLAAVHNQRRDWAAMDTVHVIAEATDVSAVAHADLDWLRQHYRLLQQSFDLHLVRRAGWICLAPAALPLVEYWAAGRHMRDGQHTEMRVGASFSDLDDLFDAGECAALKSRDGFQVLQRIEVSG